MPRRSATEWGVRAGLAVVVATTGYAAVTRTLAYTVRSSNVERAHALAPDDGRITSLLARARAGVDANAANRADADRLARDALRRDPTAVAAVSTLGLDAQVRNDTPGARRLFAYAERLSRRDLQTQLWAIEDAVGRGDIANALEHYDIALRTTRDASTLLFPVLASAIADAPVRAALTRTLARGPVWGPHFIGYAVGEGPDPRASADLLVDLRRARLPVTGGAQATLVDRLVAGGFTGEAWSYYTSIHPTADRRTSRDRDFTADAAAPSVFDWTPAADTGISTSIQREAAGGGAFHFDIPRGVGGVLLRQMQLLPPGGYQLAGRSAGIDAPADAQPYWTLTCLDGRVLGRVGLSAPTDAKGAAFAGRLHVPAGCPSQMLALSAEPSDGVTGISGRIEWAWLRPVGGDR